MSKLGPRLGIIVCAALILFWVVKPGGGGFMPVPVGHGPAPAWSATALDGTVQSSTNLAGRVLFVNFWATWCPPCVREIPDLAAFHQAHAADGLTVVGMSVDEAGPDVVRKFVAKNSIPYPVVMAGTNLLEAFGAAGSIPTTFVVDRKGNFVARYLGALSREELERVAAPLLAATNAPAR
jgi:thiol-disulfide isomerase/thioredoxin